MRLCLILLLSFLPLFSNQYHFNPLNNQLFGKNDELIALLHNGGKISFEDLKSQRNIYLKSIIDKESFNGLYLKGGTSRNFPTKRNGYNIKLEWNLLDSGLFGSRRDLKELLLKKELDYDYIADRYRVSELELSIYKMDYVNNFVNYIFLKQQKEILQKIYQRAQKQYRSSYITISQLYDYKKDLRRTEQMLLFYKGAKKEPYDYRMKNFIKHIEEGNLVDKSKLLTSIIKNNYELKSIKSKMLQAKIEKSWKDKVKTSLYVENKKYNYLNQSDTVAGLNMQIPLNFKKQDDKSQEIEIKANRLQEQYLIKKISRSVEEIYQKINYHKNYIKSLKSDIAFFIHESKNIKFKQKYPISSKEPSDFKIDLYKIKLDISREYQEIWRERTEILKLLLRLQSISGIQIVRV